MSHPLVAPDEVVSDDEARARFFREYHDPRHAIMDWRLGYSVVKRLMCPLTNRTVLDYGCGNGRFSRLLRDRGAHVIGVDISSQAIDEARRKHAERINYYLINSGDLSQVPLRAIDVAVSTFVLCCVKERADLDRILKAIYERIKAGGTYVLSEPHPDAPGRDFYSMRRVPKDVLKEGTPLDVQFQDGSGLVLHDFWHSRETYLDALRSAGFIIEHVIEPTMNTYPDEPYWKDERHYPPFIIFRARK
ncbi:MAG: class I SAM-dependent methyltransferase [Phycisphaerae bacterium]|nr:class I SAM-dependent methyltransferase [Phycisphaerae bacterium]